jgi:hypothetical protein
MLLKLVIPQFDRLAQGGTVTKWLKSEGEWVNYGEDLLDISIEEMKVLKQRTASARQILDESAFDGVKAGETFSSNRWDWPMRITSSDMGILRRIEAKEGDQWEVGHLLAVLTTEEDEPIDVANGEIEAASNFRVVVNAIEDQ